MQWMRAPRSDASARQMFSPSPLPPYLLMRLGLAISNAWNSRACIAGSIPHPVSMHLKNTRMWLSRLGSSAGSGTASTDMVTDPSEVNFIAFHAKLAKICWIRYASPTNKGALQLSLSS